MKEMDNIHSGEIVLYQTEDSQVTIDVEIEDKTVWLTKCKWSCFLKETNR
jgi:hypothetical protein